MDLLAKLRGEDQLTPKLEKVKKELEETSKRADKLDVIRKKFENLESANLPLQRKLAATKKLIAEMNMEGLNDNGLFVDLAAKAGVYADAIGDAAAAVKQFSNDTMGLQAAAQGMQLVTASASVLQGAMGMLGVENENVNKTILKVQSSLAILNGVQAIANVLNKDSALMLTLKKLATIGATVTTTTFTAALSKHALVEALLTTRQKIATTIQTAWNVAKAIGMAMLGNFTGLALLAVGAVVGLTIATKSSTDAEKENAESKDKLKTSTEQLAEKNREAAQSIVSEEAKVVASYKAMQTAWKNLTTEQEKAKWLEENKSKFQNLGVAIDNVAAGEEFFVSQSSNIIAALQSRAKAAALYELYLKALQKQYELKNQKTLTYHYKEGDSEETKKQKEQQAQEQHRQDIKAQDEYVEQLAKDFQAAQFKADEASNKTLSNFKPKTTNKPKTNKPNKPKTEKTEKPKPSEASIAAPTKNDQFDKGSIEDFRQSLQNARTLINQIKSDYSDGLIDADEAKKQIDEVNKKLKELGLHQIELEVTSEGIEAPKPKASEASIIAPEKSDTFDKGSIEDFRQSLQNARTLINQIKSDYSDGLIDSTTAKKQIDEVNAKLHSLNLQPIELVVTADGIEDVKSAAEQAAESFEILQEALGSMGGDVQAMIDSFSNLAVVLSSEQATAAEEAGATLTTLGNALQGIAGKGVAAKIGATMAAIGQIILGFATASAQASEMGPWGWLAFVAAGLAATATTIAQITSYADGGIVQGTTYHGDRVLTRLNAGEMVLNKAEQSNLFNMLKNGNANGGGGKVEFTIKGSTLKGCLDNYNSKLDRQA